MYLWTPPVAKKASTTPVGPRIRELRFRETRRDLLNSLVGQWVCLEAEAIVANGPDIARVIEEARQRGVKVPYVFKVSSEPEGSVRMGL
jgi:hypothetical protein